MTNSNEITNADRVFYYFKEISKIPHGSGHTEKIADYLVNFAKERSLFVRRDESNNVIIKKAAHPNYAEKPTVILQGHTDMVLAKTETCRKDLINEPITLKEDGDYIYADGTTLGADDGIAVAYILSLLDNDTLAAPAIEAVFTSDEEIGLIGAWAIDTSDLLGKVLINIDSDVEGVFIAGCAGGVRLDVNLPARAKKSTTESTLIEVDGLKGGHSGAAINKGRENAIKILAQLLEGLGDIEIGALSAGNADNAIPRYASCRVIGFNPELFAALKADITDKYSKIEPNISITCTACQENTDFFSKDDSANIIALINEEPTGVIAMNAESPSLVETSLNLGIATSDADGVTLTFSLRSSIESEKAKLATRVKEIAKSHGASIKEHGAYPAWEYNKNSHLREVMCNIFKNEYGKDAKVITIHAGLECGIFSEKIKGLDCVSIGPDLHDIHTTEERLSVSSAVRVYNFIKEVLKTI